MDVREREKQGWVEDVECSQGDGTKQRVWGRKCDGLMRLLVPSELMMMNAHHSQWLFSGFRTRVKLNKKRRSLQNTVACKKWVHSAASINISFLSKALI